jgi:hypothetical protein
VLQEPLPELATAAVTPSPDITGWGSAPAFMGSRTTDVAGMPLSPSRFSTRV